MPSLGVVGAITLVVMYRPFWPEASAPRVSVFRLELALGAWSRLWDASLFGRSDVYVVAAGVVVVA